MTRFSARNPCPVCSGWDTLPRGNAKRCHGFLSDCGQYAHCAREECAGKLLMNLNSATYAHVLTGDCGCGMSHGKASSHRKTNRSDRASIRATYDYQDANGTLLFQTVRFEPKGFSQRRPDGAGGWIWNLRGVERVLYRLPELLGADPAETIWLPEGEKDVEALVAAGLVATTNPMGAGKWRSNYAKYFRGRSVVLLPDNDAPGREHMLKVARSLVWVASSIKLLWLPNLPVKGDVSDWLSSGGTAEALKALAAQTPEYEDETANQPEVQAGPDIAEPIYSGSANRSAHHLTDLGNARRLVEKYGGDLRFCPAWNKWLLWDGARWAVDNTGDVVRLAKETVLGLYDEAASEQDEERRRVLGKWAVASESRGRITAMVELAKTERGIAISPDDLDADPWLLNCMNGTLDLRTGELWEHRRKDLCTKRVPIHYDSTATCPRFQAFLEKIMGGSSGLIGFLQRAIGYAITGITKEHVIFIWHGSGANGKTTLIEVVRTMLGEYAKTADSSLLMVSKNDGVRNDVARLAGARFVSAAETESGRRLAETLVKQLSGGDKVTARFLFAEHFEFDPQFKIFLATNHRPAIRGNDKGIWRRIRLVPFSTTIPDDQQDKELPEKLRAELPGVLAWTVRGCLEWQEQGLGTPPEVNAATESYRQDMDVLGTFIAERCLQRPGVKAPTGALYRAYVGWCDETGEKHLSQQEFGLRLEERGFARDRSARTRYRLGITLVTGVTDNDADSGKSSGKSSYVETSLKPVSSSVTTSPADDQAQAEMTEVEL
jgi:putative DNA primase/helicase